MPFVKQSGSTPMVTSPPDRANETREAMARPDTALYSGETGRFKLDMSKKPANMAYKWVREFNMNDHDKDNVSSALETGYTPVPASRHPEKRIAYLPGLKLEQDDGDILRRGGCFLAERPMEVEMAFREEQAQKNWEAEQKARTYAYDAGKNVPKSHQSQWSANEERVSKTFYPRGKRPAAETQRFE